jgi:hypothetical protein
MDTERGPRQRSFLRSRAGLTLIVFVGIAGFFVVTEHTAHFFGALPFLLLALCPLMHVFMHGGHGGGHAGHTGQAEADSRRTDGGER